MSKYSQKGAALLMVLIIIALMSSVVVLLSERTQYSIYRAQNLANREQLYWYLMGGEARAIGQITRSRNSEDTSGYLRLLSGPRKYPVEGGSIELSIREMSDCFDLNSFILADPGRGGSGVNSPVYKQLMTLLRELKVDSSQAVMVAERLLDWIDTDTIATGGSGAEDLYYSRQTQPYRAANTLLADPTELHLLNVSDEVVQRVLPYVCALPVSGTSKININVVDKSEIIVAASMGAIDYGGASRIIQQRPVDGYKNLAQVSDQVPEDARSAVGKFISLSPGRYYQVRTRVTLNQSYRSMLTLVDVSADNGGVISRRFGDPM